MFNLDYAAAWAPPRDLLVLHDLTRQADNAAWRAGMIARDMGADVCLMHATDDGATQANEKPRLDDLATGISGRLGVRVDVRLVPGDPVSAVVQAGAGLVVLGSQRPNVLREWLFGTPAERLIRLSRSPVLVVKNTPAVSYRRVLVPVDFGPAAVRALAAAKRLSQGAAIDVFHSLAVRDEVTLRAADVPEAIVRERRNRNADRARARIYELIGMASGPVSCAIPSIGFGHAPSMVLTKVQSMRADLVVIGKRRRGLLADFFLGSVTRRLLAAARSDVLVLTQARTPGPARSGARIQIGANLVQVATNLRDNSLEFGLADTKVV